MPDSTTEPQLFETDQECDNRLHKEQLRKLIRDGFLDPIPEYDVREAVRFRAVYFGADERT